MAFDINGWHKNYENGYCRMCLRNVVNQWNDDIISTSFHTRTMVLYNSATM